MSARPALHLPRILVVLVALAWAAHGAEVEYSFTGIGVNGSIARGWFTTVEVTEPNYYAPGAVYQSFSLIISNIPGVDPGFCAFNLTEMDSSIFSTDAAGTPSILPLGGHNFGPPTENHLDLSGGEQERQSILSFNRFYRDTITWSALTLVTPPSPPVLSGQMAGANFTLLWETNAVNFVLEEATSLSAPDWTVVTNAPVTVDDNFSITLLRVGEGMRFYRLAWLGP